MLRLAFDFIITWRETRTRPNAYKLCQTQYFFTEYRGGYTYTTFHFYRN